MRVDIETVNPTQPAFKPAKVTVTLQTQEEFDAFRAIFQTNVSVPAVVEQNMGIPKEHVQTICTHLADMIYEYKRITDGKR